MKIDVLEVKLQPAAAPPWGVATLTALLYLMPIKPRRLGVPQHLCKVGFGWSEYGYNPGTLNGALPVVSVAPFGSASSMLVAVGPDLVVDGPGKVVLTARGPAAPPHGTPVTCSIEIAVVDGGEKLAPIVLRQDLQPEVGPNGVGIFWQWITKRA